eukprot:scaffold9119_cov32-Tisochrysis_lutea.AAC.2
MNAHTHLPPNYRMVFFTHYIRDVATGQERKYFIIARVRARASDAQTKRRDEIGKTPNYKLFPMGHGTTGLRAATGNILQKNRSGSNTRAPHNLEQGILAAMRLSSSELLKMSRKLTNEN